MPHTQRKKKSSRPKRVEEVDENGWTRITNSKHSNQVKRVEPPQGYEYYEDTGETLVRLEGAPPLPPAEVITLETIKKQYDTMQKKWLASESCRTLQRVLEDVHSKDPLEIKTCMLLGTGSYSGFYRGWILRDDTACVQTNIFMSVVDAIEKLQGSRPTCYAQEPLYNDLDTEFLSTLQVSKIEDPKAFELMGTASFAYTPGAELDVCTRTMKADPSLYLSHKLDIFWRTAKGAARTDAIKINGKTHNKDLDDDDAGAFASHRDSIERECHRQEEFLRAHDAIAIPDLDIQNHPFHDMHLYYAKSSINDIET